MIFFKGSNDKKLVPICQTLETKFVSEKVSRSTSWINYPCRIFGLTFSGISTSGVDKTLRFSSISESFSKYMYSPNFSENFMVSFLTKPLHFSKCRLNFPDKLCFERVNVQKSTKWSNFRELSLVLAHTTMFEKCATGRFISCCFV